MHALPPSLRELIAALNGLPGVGPRTAERLALYLVQTNREAAEQLVRRLAEACERLQFCEQCGALTETQPCPVCADPERDQSMICVVEKPVDIPLIERARVYRGLYHVLGGKISPLRGVEPEDLRIAQLEERVRRGGVREVILALPTDVEGDATAHYLAETLGGLGVKLTRLGYGMPAGAELEHTDELTLGRAMEGRAELG